MDELLGVLANRLADDRPVAGPQAKDQEPQEAAEDIVQPEDQADNGLRPQGAADGEVADEDTIVVDTGRPVDVRNDPQEDDTSQDEGAQLPKRRSGRERRPRRFFDQALAVQSRPVIPASYEEAVGDKEYG